MSGFPLYSDGMKDLISMDQKAKIAALLIRGESPLTISNNLNITVNDVLGLLGDRGFSCNLLEMFKTQAKGAAFIAHNNILRIAFDPSPLTSAATKLKASKILIDIARELEELHPDDMEPANMTQAQLVERLGELQKEVIARAKPVESLILDAEPSLDLDDMLD